MVCKFKNIFGLPKEGVHKYRIMNIAVVDVILTIIAAYIINIYIYPTINVSNILFWLFILGIFFHRLFDVRTTIDKILF